MTELLEDGWVEVETLGHLEKYSEINYIVLSSLKCECARTRERERHGCGQERERLRE